MHPQPDTTTPPDFPRDYGQGAVAGVQPKLLVRKVGEVYVLGLTDEELYARYDMCFDLVNQLADYCHRKLEKNPEWTAHELFEKLRASVQSRTEWGLSVGETAWVLRKLCPRMGWPSFE